MTEEYDEQNDSSAQSTPHTAEQEEARAVMAEHIRRQQEIALKNSQIRRCVLEAGDDQGQSWNETVLSQEDLTRTSDGEMVIKSNGRAAWVAAWAGTKEQAAAAVRERLLVLKICRLFNSLGPPRQVNVLRAGVLCEEQPDRPTTFRYVEQWCVDPQVYKVAKGNQTAFAFSLFSWIVSQQSLLVVLTGRLGNKGDTFCPAVHRVHGSKVELEAIDDFLATSVARHRDNVVCRALGIGPVGFVGGDASCKLSGKIPLPELLVSGQSALIPVGPSPRTLVVDLEGFGNHSSLEEAVEAAVDGDRIALHPGIYTAPLVVSKAVVLVGQGQGTVVFKPPKGCSDPAITLSGDVQLVNVVIHAPAKSDAPAIAVDGGSPVVRTCDIVGPAVLGGTSSPALVGSRVRLSRSHGVTVQDSCSATVSGNDISDNALHGCHVVSLGSLTLVDNDIANNGGCGVVFAEETSVTVEQNRIRNNTEMGIRVTNDDALPVLRANAIACNGSGGVHHLAGRGVLEGNDIVDNGGPGVLIMTNASPALFRNRIHGNKGRGIHIKDTASAFLDENQSFENLGEGILVDGSAKPTICENRIFAGKAPGLVISEAAGGKYVTNRVFGNAGADMVVATTARPVLDRNVLVE